MILDDERQRFILKQLLAAANVPGQAVPEVFALMQAVEKATVDEDNDINTLVRQAK